MCSVRLDFESFTTQGPTSTAELLGGACVDSFTATGSSGQTSPVICGITTLDIDHTGSRGNTIEEIAMHKAGIMKKGRLNRLIW